MKYFYDFRIIAIVYFLSVVIITIQTFLLGETDQGWTHYNNYVIFKQSYFHLLEGGNLYDVYPEEHWDLFKYSPTFALLFLTANFSDVIGVFIWSMINAFVLFFAIKNLPLKHNIRVHILWFILIELITSLQNEQSNALIAGLLIYSFIFFEEKRYSKSTLCIAGSVFIKIFGVIGFVFYLFSKKKIKYILSSITWLTLLFLLPVLVISFDELIWQYQNWGILLQNDHGAVYSYGQSMMGVLLVWFNYDAPKAGVVLVGLFLLLMSFININQWKEKSFRLLILCSLLIWIIIFNHKAESATFIIAVSGIAIWFFSQEYNKFDFILIILAFLLTVLSATDIYPKYLRVNYLKPYLFKVIPCILIWFKLTFDLIFYSYKIRKESFIT